MTKKEIALEYFNKKFHCSQAVVAAYKDECDLTLEQALKLGACFGSGMRKGEVCGACTGALMVLGLMYGQYDINDVESRMKANKVNDEMLYRFKELNGSYICNELLGCDLSSSEGIEYANKNKLFTDFCPRMVASAIDVLEGIISQE